MGQFSSKFVQKPDNKTAPQTFKTYKPVINPRYAVTTYDQRTANTINNYGIWKENVSLFDFREDELARRLKETKDLDATLKRTEEAVQQVRLNRIKTEQLCNPTRPTYESKVIPIHQLQPCREIGFRRFFDEKLFSVKPKRPQLNKPILDHIEHVSHPLPSSQLLIELDGVQILRKDIQTLLRLNWLNDEIINAYMYLLVVRGKAPGRKKVYAFNTFFYPKYRDSGYSSIRRWTRKIDIFNHDVILVPIHLGNHWCLATIDFKNRKIDYYDSLGGSSSGCSQRLLNYLQEELSDKKKQDFDRENWKLNDHRGGINGVPAQENGSDCGVFACTYAEYLTRPSSFDFTQSDMPYFRKKMIYEITKGSILE